MGQAVLNRQIARNEQSKNVCLISLMVMVDQFLMGVNRQIRVAALSLWFTLRTYAIVDDVEKSINAECLRVIKEVCCAHVA